MTSQSGTTYRQLHNAITQASNGANVLFLVHSRRMLDYAFNLVRNMEHHEVTKLTRRPQCLIEVVCGSVEIRTFEPIHHHLATPPGPMHLDHYVFDAVPAHKIRELIDSRQYQV